MVLNRLYVQNRFNFLKKTTNQAVFLHMYKRFFSENKSLNHVNAEQTFRHAPPMKQVYLSKIRILNMTNTIDALNRKWTSPFSKNNPVESFVARQLGTFSCCCDNDRRQYPTKSWSVNLKTTYLPLFLYL